MEANIKAIIEDDRSGSSKIIKKTLDLLKNARKEDRFDLCREIVKAHPSMSGLTTIMNFLESDLTIDRIIEKFHTMNTRTSENLERLVEGNVVTVISRSHIVERGLTTAKKINVLESCPEKEGRDTARWLKDHGKEVDVYHDAFMCYAVKRSDVVAVGADSLFSTGFLNKTGTLPLALTAQYFNIPFYVVAPSYKYTTKKPDYENIFEFVPHELVTAFVWEEGVVEEMPSKEW